MARGYFPAGGFGNGGITTIVHGTLTVDGWQTDTDGTFYQPIVALGVTGAEDCHPQIQLEHIAGVAKSTWQAQCEAFGEFAASCWAETSEAVITFYCYEKPTVDLNIIAYGFDYVSNAVNIDTGTANIVQSNVNSDISVPSSKVVYDVNNELGARIDTLNSNLSSAIADRFPWYKKTATFDANTTVSTGIYECRCSITNAPMGNHAMLLVIMNVGTPFQIYWPDNQNYFYKRTGYSNGAFTGAWTKLTPAAG